MLVTTLTTGRHREGRNTKGWKLRCHYNIVQCCGRPTLTDWTTATRCVWSDETRLRVVFLVDVQQQVDHAVAVTVLVVVPETNILHDISRSCKLEGAQRVHISAKGHVLGLGLA